MAVLDDVKLALRISSTAYDDEVNDLIEAAKLDLEISGVAAEAIVESDPLVKRAVTIYVKANFGWDNPDAERLQRAYDLLKQHLSLAKEFNAHAVTFTVTSGGSLVEDAYVEFNGSTKRTSASGTAVFYVIGEHENLEYKVYKSGYGTEEEEIDVDGAEAVAIELTED